jgi:hypothetical protein
LQAELDRKSQLPTLPAKGDYPPPPAYHANLD